MIRVIDINVDLSVLSRKYFILLEFRHDLCLDFQGVHKHYKSLTRVMVIFKKPRILIVMVLSLNLCVRAWYSQMAKCILEISQPVLST